MKKINPKDLEVNPKFSGSSSNENPNNPERATTVCTDENYGCTDTGTIVTLAIDCTVDTEQSICKCPTQKNCVNTIDGCADTVSRGELCCPATKNYNCNYSIKCDSIEYCLVSKDVECTVNDTDCEAEITTFIDKDCDTI